MDQRPQPAGLGGDLRDRLQRPHLVVGQPDRDQAGIFRDVRRGCACRPVHREHRHRAALGLELAHGAQHRLMLGLPGHHPAAGREPAPGAEQGQVDRLGAARAPDQVARTGAQRLRLLVAGGIEGGARRPAFGVRALGVGFGNAPQRGANFGQHRRAAGVVEVGPGTASGAQAA